MHDQYDILAADLAAALEESGGLESVDGGDPVRILEQESGLLPGEYDASITETLVLYYLNGDVEEKVVDSRLTYKGKHWQVLAVDRIGAAVKLLIGRGTA